MADLTLADLIEQVADEIGRDGEDEAIRWAIDRTTDRANRLLRTRWMLCRATAPVTVAVEDGDEYLALGDDFAGETAIRFIDAAGSPTDLIFVPNLEASDLYERSAAGAPTHYSIYENQIRLLPTAAVAGTLEIWQYERFGLEDDADTNWLLKYHRDIYINGAVYHLKRRLREPPAEIREYKNAFEEGIEEVRLATSFDVAGGGRGEPVEYF